MSYITVKKTFVLALAFFASKIHSSELPIIKKKDVTDLEERIAVLPEEIRNIIFRHALYFFKKKNIERMEEYITNSFDYCRKNGEYQRFYGYSERKYNMVCLSVCLYNPPTSASRIDGRRASLQLHINTSGTFKTHDLKPMIANGYSANPAVSLNQLSINFEGSNTKYTINFSKLFAKDADAKSQFATITKNNVVSTDNMMILNAKKTATLPTNLRTA